jgi:hypothetical protein
MANVFMLEGGESIFDRNIDVIADTLKVMLVTAVFAPTRAVQFIDEGGASDAVDARAAGTTDQTLGGKVTGKDGTGFFAYLDGNDSTFLAVAAGTAIAGVVVYKDTGTPTTSKILAYFDIADITPNGSDITIVWAAPASGGVLKLAV